MVRTQVYLTEKERRALVALARATGKKQSELIRKAVDQLVERSSALKRQAVLTRAAGMWKDREDLPDARVLRATWDRR